MKRTYRFIILLVVGLLVLPQNVQATLEPMPNEDLASYYPNLDIYQNQYLTGYNYITSPASPTVLWFKRQDQYTYLMYNSNPNSSTATCHYDQLSWWDDNYLRYVRTVDNCSANSTEIDYDSPIIFLPRYWSGGSWTLSGSSRASFYLNRNLVCIGTTIWTGKILGLEQLSSNPVEMGLHWQTRQSTTWTSGQVSSGCSVGYTTDWVEDYWLSADIPGPSGPSKGIKRSKGGNLNGADNWDIWMDDWVSLAS